MKAIAALELWKQLVILVPLGVVLLISTYTDLKERKVYNKVTYTAFFVGLVAHTIAFGPMGFVWALVAALATFFACLVFFIFIPAGGFGGGDLKLLTATAAFVGGQGIMAVSWLAPQSSAGPPPGHPPTFLLSEELKLRRKVRMNLLEVVTERQTLERGLGVS